MALEANSSADSGSISRRTIVKGAAWAAPVMIAAVAVPAAVASGATLAPQVTNWTNGSHATRTFTLRPAPADNTQVTLNISGEGWSFNANGTLFTTRVTVNGGSFSVAIYPGKAGVAGALTVVSAANSVSLTRT